MGLATVHLSISDATGDSAIFEYIGGELEVHHGRAYRVMTNSPPYGGQLALDAYWKEVGGTVILPGTNRAADRFARASFYVDAIPRTDDTRTAVAAMLGVIRNASVPLGTSTPDQPNISSTRWRVIADDRNLVYDFESTLSPNTFWIPLGELDLSAGAPVRMLPVVDGRVYAGSAVEELVEARPFEFLGVR